MHAFQIRSPWLVVVTLAAAGAAAGAGYGLAAPKEYRAAAQLLISPVLASDSTYTGIDVLRESGGGPTAAKSAAALLRTPLVADAVRAQLGLRRSADSLLAALTTHVVDSSDVVDVTARDGSPLGAAQLANAFVATFVNQRTASFDRDVAAALRRDERAIERLPAGSPAATRVRAQLDRLRPLDGAPDPSLRQAGQATAPTEPSWPQAGELAADGAAVGLGAGILTVLLLMLVRRAPRSVLSADASRASERALERLVEKLDARLVGRESALRAREHDLQRALEDLKAAQAAGRPDVLELARRERELEARVAAVTNRELAAARQSAALAVRAAESEPRSASVPDPPVSRASSGTEAAQAPVPAAAVPPVFGAGPYNLHALERLVEARGSAHPGRVDEWAAYLFSLREHVAADGSVPASFDWLIQDAFGELLG